MTTEAIQFFLPGPSYVLESVRQAMTKPMVGHRSAGFKDFYVNLSKRLPALLRTSGDVMVATGSSTLVMESAVISCAAQDVLNLTNGAFSERWHSISKSVGKSADKIAAPWGEAIDPEVVHRRWGAYLLATSPEKAAPDDRHLPRPWQTHPIRQSRGRLR